MFPLRLSADQAGSNGLPTTFQSSTRSLRSVLKVMARPRMNENDKRTIQVNIRLTVAENTKVIAYAQASGVTPANWIRRVVFTGKFPPLKLSSIDAALYLELKRIGVNLNQITHRINQGDFPREFLAGQMELAVMLNKILTALADDGQPD